MDYESIRIKALEMALDSLLDRTDPDIELFCEYWSDKWIWKMADWMMPPHEDPADMLMKHEDCWRHEVKKWWDMQENKDQMGCVQRAREMILDMLEEEREQELLRREAADMVNAEGAMR